VSLVRYW